MRSQPVAACTASVQQSLAKEVVIWKHGILVLPPIIHDTVACMQARPRTQALVVSYVYSG